MGEANYGSSIGSSIEGEKMFLATRQFFTPPPVKCRITKIKQHRFHLGMRGEAEIREAYSDPANTIYYSTSMTQTGDKVQGTTVSGWARKPLGKPHVEVYTGTHSASLLNVTGGCLAQVAIPSREYLNNEGMQQRQPPVTPIIRTIAKNE